MLTQVVRSIWTDPSNAGIEKYIRLGAALLYQVYKRVVGKPFVLSYRTGLKINMYNDNPQYSNLVYFRHPDMLEVSHIKSLLVPGSVVYDIGANIGVYEILLGDRIGGIRIYAFEASEACYQRLLDLKRLNNLSDANFVPVHAAISDRDGLVSFGSHEPLHPENAIMQDGNGRWNVPCRSIDSMVYGEEIDPPDVIKVDVEGFERQVFRGAIRTLKEYCPSLMFECLGKTGDFREIRELLQGLGYQLYLIGDKEISPAELECMDQIPAASGAKNVFAEWKGVT